MYDLHLTPEQHEIRDTVRDFVEREIKPAVLHPDRLQALEQPLPLDLVRKASELGLRALTLGEAAGGAGADALTCCIVFEELAAGDAHIAATLAETARIAGVLFDRVVSPRLRDRYLPRFLDDPEFHLAYVGPQHDAELGWGYHRPAPIESPLALRARRCGEGWEIDGEARFVANAPLARLFVVEAQVEGARDSVALLVPDDSTGLAVRAARTDGESSRSPTLAWYHGVRGTAVFRSCRLPADHVLPPAAVAELRAGLHGEATSAPYPAAIALGVGRAASEAAVTYAKLRVQGGRPIVEHQAIGRILADVAVRLSVARSIVWQAAWASDHRDAYADRSLPDLPLSTVAGVYAAQAVHEAVELATECFGAMGVMRDMPLHKYMHDARICAQSGTSSAVGKFRIAEAFVGYRRNAAEQR